MRKKLFFCLLLLTSVDLFAQEEKFEFWYESTYDKVVARLVEVKNTGETYSIPSGAYRNDMATSTDPVIEVRSGAFSWGNEKLRELKVPGSIKKLGNGWAPSQTLDKVTIQLQNPIDFKNLKANIWVVPHNTYSLYVEANPEQNITESENDSIKNAFETNYIFSTSSGVIAWERSSDEGMSWERFDCSNSLNPNAFKEDCPQMGTIYYRAITNSEYDPICAVRYVVPLSSYTPTLSASKNPATVKDKVQLSATPIDKNYTYSWYKDGHHWFTAKGYDNVIFDFKAVYAGEYYCTISDEISSITTPSIILMAEKVEQKLEVNAEILAEVGDHIVLPATTDAGLSVNYSSMNNNVASISANEVDIISEGETQIVASQYGDDDYYALNYTIKLKATKKYQSVTVDSLITKQYGDLPFTLPKYTDQGNTITYTSNERDVADISGNTVTIVGAGTAVIEVTQEGNSIFEPLPKTSISLVVNKLSQSLSIETSIEKIYGDESFSLPLNTDQGLPLTYVSTNSSVATIDGNIVKIIGAGVTEIIVSQDGNNNYQPLSTITIELIVNKRAQSFEFPDIPYLEYGSDPIELPAYTDQNLKLEYTSSNDEIVSFDDNVLYVLKPGNVTIFAIQYGDFNYSALPETKKEIIINKAPQIIEINPFDEYVYGDVDTIELNRYSNKGLDLSYTSSNTDVAVINDYSVVICGAGETSIIVSQFGNDYYQPAETITLPLKVRKAEQTITFENLPTLIYGDDPYTIECNCSSGKDVILESSNPSIVSIENYTLHIHKAGKATISASAPGDSNYYTASTIYKDVSIEKADLFVTAKNASRIYGDQNPEFELEYEGFKNDDNSENALKSQPQAICEANNLSSVGEYPINVTSVIADNYKVNSMPGTLSIEKALLTIKAEDKQIEQGMELPIFTLEYYGFKNSDSPQDLDELPTIFCNATELSFIGQYEIELQGGEDNNYQYELINGVLDIISSSGINDIIDEDEYRIYDIKGHFILTTSCLEYCLDKLPKGIYIINNTKISIK